jgi:hypothetical protein
MDLGHFRNFLPIGIPLSLDRAQHTCGILAPWCTLLCAHTLVCTHSPKVIRDDERIFQVKLLASEGNARAGIFSTPHGDIQTPVFAPVGTQATVKVGNSLPNWKSWAPAWCCLTLTICIFAQETIWSQRWADCMISCSWSHPILTDSGGFQVFSLADTRTIDEDGVTFRSHIDGSSHRFTPRKPFQIQENLGRGYHHGLR